MRGLIALQDKRLIFPSWVKGSWFLSLVEGGGGGGGRTEPKFPLPQCLHLYFMLCSFKNHMESQVLTAISLGEFVLQLVPGHEGLQECRKCRNAGGGQTKQSL